MKSSNIGGQAVLEGIMMRHRDIYSIAVRKPDGEIAVKTEPYKSVFGNGAIWKKPVFRGVVSFVDSLIVGTKCLMYSASFYEEEEAKKDTEKKSDDWMMYLTMVISILIAVAVFMVAPYLLASLFRKFGASEAVITLIEAVVKIILFLGYMLLISRLKDIQRVFMYHGAEHKCINCVEQGMELTVENVMKCSRQHKRCGTSFLLLVIIVSILFHFLFIGLPVMWMRVAVRILMIPVIAGIAFEFIRLAGNSENKCIVFLSRPGMALQNLTTREPEPDMVEVAIAAVEAVFDWKSYLKENFGWEERKH